MTPRPAAPLPLIAMRERQLLQILDLAITLIRTWWRPLLVPVLVGSLPCIFINYWIIGKLIDEDYAPILWLLLLTMESPWATALLELKLGGLVFGQNLSHFEIMKKLFSGFTKMLVFQFGLRLIMVLLVFPVLIMPIWLGFMNCVILLERYPWSGLLKRHRQLAFRSELGILNLHVLFFGASFIVASWVGISTFLSIMNHSKLWEEPDWIFLNNWKLHILSWTVIQFFAIVRFLLYLDSRIRSEGWDLQNRIRDLIASQGRTIS